MNKHPYQDILHFLDEGFCIIELIFDSAGRPVDWLHIEANPEFANQSRVPNVIGQLASEVFPAIDPHWLDFYGNVVATGIPSRLEQQATAANKWCDVYAVKVGGKESTKVAALFKDVTERRGAEDAARQQKEDLRFFADAVERTVDAIITFGSDMRIRTWNKGAELLFGWSAEEVIGKTTVFLQMHYVGYPPNAQRDVVIAEAQRQNYWRGEVECRRKNGVTVTTLATSTIIRNNDGVIVGYVSTHHDITRRKHDEESQKCLLRLSHALRPITDPIEVQEVAARTLGERLQADRVFYVQVESDEYVVVREYANGVPPVAGHYPIAAFGPRPLADLRSGKTATHSNIEEAPSLCPTERATYAAMGTVSRVVVPLVKSGTLVAALAVHMTTPRMWTQAEVSLVEHTAELTWEAVERAKVEDALRKSEEQFRVLVLASSAVTYRMSQDWSVMHYLHGHGFLANTEEKSISWLPRYIPPEDRQLMQDTIREAIRTKGVFELEHKVYRADGSIGWVRSTTVPLLDAAGEITEWFGAASDITDRKRAEDALKESEAKALALVSQLEETDRSRNQFLSVLSHELRNPLAIIAANLSLLEIARTERQLAISTESIRRQVDQLTELVDDLLDFTRLRQNRIVLRKARIDLSELLRNAIGDVEIEFARKGLVLSSVLPKEPVIMEIDPIRFGQCIGNVLHNALKFTQPAGEVTLSFEVEGSEAVTRVRDNGIGIGPDLLGRIFEPFVQANTSLHQQHGLGLGLSVVRGIVEMHGGSVFAASEGIGKGSLFTIRLPLSAPDPARDVNVTEGEAGGGSGIEDFTKSASNAHRHR